MFQLFFIFHLSFFLFLLFIFHFSFFNFELVPFYHGCDEEEGEHPALQIVVVMGKKRESTQRFRLREPFRKEKKRFIVVVGKERESTQRLRFREPFRKEKKTLWLWERKGRAPSASDLGCPFENQKTVCCVCGEGKGEHPALQI